jgi:HlyD family secretion protein
MTQAWQKIRQAAQTAWPKIQQAGQTAWRWFLDFYKHRPRTAIASLIAIILLAVIAGSCAGSRKNLGEEASLTYKVKRSPLTISVTDSGSIENREKVIVRSQVQGRAAIIWLIDEGRAVKKDDLLVELDSSSFEDSKVDIQIQVENGTAGVVRASETLAVTKNQAEADIEKAELTLKFAELALEKYKEGEYPEALQKAQADIAIAKEEVRRSEEKLGWSQKLSEQEFITRSELQADELALKRDQINLQTAENRLKLLEKYTYPEQMEKLQSDAKQATLALDRVKRKAKADILQAEVDLRTKESGYERLIDKLNKIVDQIKNCRITAPVDGMVVHATSIGNNRWRDPLAIGQTVNERQDLICLPTTGAMNAEFRIQEASLTKAKLGTTAQITLDALPGRKFSGRITKTAALPDATQSFWNSDLKEYNCQIEIDPPTDDLRPGMSCNIEIIVKELDDVLYVPIQAVLRINDSPTVYLKTMRGYVSRPVKTGLDNNRMIHILSGLEEGDEVLLSPPLKAAERTTRKEPSPARKYDADRPPIRPEQIPSEQRMPSETTKPAATETARQPDQQLQPSGDSVQHPGERPRQSDQTPRPERRNPPHHTERQSP